MNFQERRKYTEGSMERQKMKRWRDEKKEKGDRG